MISEWEKLINKDRMSCNTNTQQLFADADWNIILKMTRQHTNYEFVDSGTPILHGDNLVILFFSFLINSFFFSSLCDNRLAPLMLATLKSCASCLCYTFREQNSIFEPFCVDNLLLTIDWPNSVHHALEATDRRNMYVVYVVRALLCIRIVVLVTISSVELTWLTWDFIHSDVPKIQQHKRVEVVNFIVWFEKDNRLTIFTPFIPHLEVFMCKFHRTSPRLNSRIPVSIQMWTGKLYVRIIMLHRTNLHSDTKWLFCQFLANNHSNPDRLYRLFHTQFQ